MNNFYGDLQEFFWMNLKKCFIILLDYQEIKISFYVRKLGDNLINFSEGVVFFIVIISYVWFIFIQIEKVQIEVNYRLLILYIII